MPDSTNHNQTFRRLLWICLGTYWFVLLLAIHWPMPFHASHFVRWDDKMVHIALYGGLAMLLSPVVEFLLPNWPVWKRAFIVVVAVMVQGAVDEVTQPLTQRTTDVLDLVADTCGAILAVLVYETMVRRMLRVSERGALPPPVGVALKNSVTLKNAANEAS